MTERPFNVGDRVWWQATPGKAYPARVERIGTAGLPHVTKPLRNTVVVRCERGPLAGETVVVTPQTLTARAGAT